MTTDRYDAIVIGAGQGGGPLATGLAGAGRRTALIERAYAGGTCINYGCTPTKTMIASARVAHLARRAADYGVQTGEIDVAMEAVRERKREMVESFRSGSRSQLEDVPNFDYLEGEARLTGPNRLMVRLNGDDEERELSTEQLFLNVGTRPSRLKLDGIDEVQAHDSTSIMELAEVPDHLLIIGGGYIGLEFAQMFRRFGADVTVINRGPRLLGREDADVADAVADILREDGIELLLESTPERVAPTGEGGVRMTVRTGTGELIVEGSHLLVATGRTPNTDGLGLDEAGVELDDKGYVRTDKRLQTSVPHIYALGDVKGGPAFTHISYDDYRIIVANLLEDGSRSVDDRPVPYAVFIDPQLGRVGMGEEEARTAGRSVKIFKMPMASVSRALETDETRGIMKAVVDAETDRILGCAMLGIEGGELMSMIEIAMMGELPYQALRDGVFAHPTLAESLNTLFASPAE
jgi:pyruvate/2-oxoglutarate dehydrogenase complex dihydrolipoamide dehydrogenase (E3) component